MSSQLDPLDPLLERWRSMPTCPPAEALQQEVWRRIADAEPLVELSFGSKLEKIFSQQSFACAFVIACALLGLFLAEVRLSRQQAQRNIQLAQAYVHLIDPLLEPSASRRLMASNGSGHD